MKWVKSAKYQEKEFGTSTHPLLGKLNDSRVLKILKTLVED